MRSSSNVVASLMTHNCYLCDSECWCEENQMNLCGPGLSGLFLITDGFYKLLWLLVLADVTRSVPPFCKIAVYYYMPSLLVWCRVLHWGAGFVVPVSVARYPLPLPSILSHPFPECI